MNISFLVPAHNEQENIEKCLDNIEVYKRKGDEIIVGLDACTDDTKEIVQRYSDVKFIESKNKLGKHGILNRLVEKASGEIIIVHDADWLLSGEKSLDSLVDSFKDKKVGGIANSWSMTFENWKKSRGVAYMGDAWSDYFLMKFKKKYYTKRENGILYVDIDKMYFPFFLNIIRKKLITKAMTSADDLERVFDIVRKGYKIVILEDIEIPHHVVIYKHISLARLYKQKLRGHLARKQIRHSFKYSTSTKNFYLPMTIFIIKGMLEIHSIHMIFSILTWILVTFLSYAHALVLWGIKPMSTEKLWEIRMR